MFNDVVHVEDVVEVGFGEETNNDVFLIGVEVVREKDRDSKAIQIGGA